MSKPRFRWIHAVSLVAALTAAAAALPQSPSKPAAAASGLSKASLAALPGLLPGDKTDGVDQVLQVLDWLARNKYGPHAGKLEHEINFRFPESVVNEYLAYALRVNPRPGLSAVNVKLQANNEISAVVWVDFDAVTQWNPLFLAPLHLVIKGKKPLRVDAVIDGRNGVLNYTLKTAYGPAGDFIATKATEELMRMIGLHQRELYNVGREPIPLPFGLQHLWCDKQVLGGET